MSYLFDVSALGTLLLAVYIVFDCIRNRTANLVKRIILYSFIFYLLNVFQVTTGGIHIPPWPSEFRSSGFQLVPFKFVTDWLKLYQRAGLDWFFRQSVKLTLLNLLLLFPLGVYLPLLFRVKSFKKAILYLALSSLTIELYQVAFTYFGLIHFRMFNVDDIILNTLGGTVGFYLYYFFLQKVINIDQGKVP